jgi:hypothetical protein
MLGSVAAQAIARICSRTLELWSPRSVKALVRMRRW